MHKYYVLVGFGWTREAKRKIIATAPFKLQDCEIPIEFTFEDNASMFPRDGTDLSSAKKQEHFVEFGFFNQEDPFFQITEVKTSFDNLEYNFFADQYSKVRYFMYGNNKKKSTVL
ncbi:MAG: hypothetical protein WCJ72_01205 [Chryseobacterium sp.]